MTTIPTDIICRYKKTWFDSLSLVQLQYLCRAADQPYAGRKMIDLVLLLSENELTRPFASATVKSIKNMLRLRSLSVSGLKYELVLRVVENNRKEALIDLMYQDLKDTVSRGSNFYDWLTETLASIRNGKHHSFVRKTTPLAAFRRAESVFAVLIRNIQFIPSTGTDDSDSLSKAIDELAFLVAKARVFLGTTEKKAVVVWILELDLILSEYMLGDNSKISFPKDLVDLLEKGICPLFKIDETGDSKASIEAKKVAKFEFVSGPKPSPLRCLKNIVRTGPSKAKAPPSANRKPKPKIITSKKEIVYKKMTSVLRKSNCDSDQVYSQLVRLMKSILSQSDDYEALGLFGSAFMALVVHFEKMDNPSLDTEDKFTIAIDHLGDVLQDVICALSMKEKDETLCWMTHLHRLTKPHALGDRADIPLCVLISWVKESKASDLETTPRRFFVP